MRTLAFSLALIGITAISVRLAAQGTGCADTQYPPELPPPSALVDSAQAIAGLAAFAGPKPMVFSLVFNPGDSVAQVRPLDKKHAAAAVSLTNYVRRQPPRELWAVRVRIASGDAPVLTLGRSKYCPPVMPRGQARATITGRIGTPGFPPPPAPYTGVTMAGGDQVPFEALISIEGRVVVARVLRPSGNAEADARIVRDLKEVKFEPAKLDGQPIQGVYRSGGQSPRP